MTRTLFFIANLDPLDGSAHALYCVRNVISLAKNAPPACKVVLLHASKSTQQQILGVHLEVEVPNLQIVGLPHIRRGIINPFHINLLFYFLLIYWLRKNAYPQDIICTASFPKMFRFIASRLASHDFKLVYEVHQLEMQSSGFTQRDHDNEIKAISLADSFFTTCRPLLKIIQKQFPDKHTTNLGLASSYKSTTSHYAVGTPLKIGYFGSLAPEQGVSWLVNEWLNIRSRCNSEIELHVFGLQNKTDAKLSSDSMNGLYIHMPLPNYAVPLESEKLNALIIPALNQSHRASIAFTKAYDYASLGLPVFCSDLPTIREVFEPDVHALYFPPGDAKALADCISRLSTEPKLGESISTNLQQRALELSWDSRARKWWEAVMQ